MSAMRTSLRDRVAVIQGAIRTAAAAERPAARVPPAPA